MSSWQPPFGFGEPVPNFTCQTPQNPKYSFQTLGGQYVVLNFIGDPNTEQGSASLDHFTRQPSPYSDSHMLGFVVLTARPQRDKPIEAPPGTRFFLDYDSAVTRLYKAEKPYTLILDGRLRVLTNIPLDDQHNDTLAATLASLPRLQEVAMQEGLHAPVLILPRVFEPEFCRELIDLYKQHGGEPSGYMREMGGKTVPILNPDFKRRKDFYFQEGDEFAPLRNRVMDRITRRLKPQIFKAFQYNITRIERFVVACYSGEDNGFFRAHRDNTTPGTAHRRFACTINLNAEEYDGGDLRFPEFGRQTYRAPTGGACIFSCSLLHEATPVTKGDRYAFLPFFYDEVGATIRAENKDTIVKGVRHE